MLSTVSRVAVDVDGAVDGSRQRPEHKALEQQAEAGLLSVQNVPPFSIFGWQGRKNRKGGWGLGLGENEKLEDISKQERIEENRKARNMFRLRGTLLGLAAHNTMKIKIVSSHATTKTKNHWTDIIAMSSLTNLYILPP